MNMDNEKTAILPAIKQGAEFAGFKLEKELGAGGMGQVWLAYQESMDRKVAVKFLFPHLVNDPTFLERFQKEIKISAKLNHPNIITAHDAGEQDGVYYLALSFVDGMEVKQKLDSEGPLNEKIALKIIREIADALDYAWSDFNLLHRDIKPANIMIDKRNSAKLMDMGISKNVGDEDSNLTMTGAMVGTPYFMSPEQAMGEKNIDFRADVYSLGGTLFNILTGSKPYDGMTAMAIVNKHINSELPDPKEFKHDLSKGVCELIKIMMAKDKSGRQSSWQNVIEDVDLVLAGKMPKTKVVKVEEKSNKPKSKLPLIIAGGIGVIIIFIGIIISSFFIIYGPKEKPQRANTSIEIIKPAQVAEVKPAQIADDKTAQIADDKTAQIADDKTAQIAEVKPAQVADAPPKRSLDSPFMNIKSITASSSDNGKNINYAVDERLDTKWSSSEYGAQWIIIDLGEVKTVSDINLHWDKMYYPGEYSLSSATEKDKWSIFLPTTMKASGGLDTYGFEGLSCRFLKIDMNKRTSFSYDIREIEIKGK